VAKNSKNMRLLYPAVEPHSNGMLETGGVDRIYWEECGNPGGEPAVVLHGGPGSGCDPWYRRLFNAGAWRVVLFDQRGCGRSTPHASLPGTSLSENTTANLLADIERLREHLGIETWMVLGGSWGSALALAYAQEHPARVTAMILFGVTTGRREEFDWLFREGLGAFFPDVWERRRDAVPEADRGLDIVEAYCRMLSDSDPGIRERAAYEWCLWESATLDWPPKTELAERFRDPSYAMAFARIVTHYVRHNAWLGDGTVLRRADRLAAIPAVLVNGRYDFQAPLGTAWALHRRWPRSELRIVDDAGHSAGHGGMTQEIIQATDRFANR
jgi:proline iminopeptidase